MKIFEQVTRGKAAGEYRLLIVDGHNSHYTVAFLLLARLHMIIVLCYAAHGTHIYQGLDVVVFAVLKHYLGQERDKLLRNTGKAIDKSNFIEIISKAYVAALTPEIIKTAFRKTGICPFNPNVITPDMLAPSKETSSESHLPVPTPSEPVKIIADMLRKLQIQETDSDEDETEKVPDAISEVNRLTNQSTSSTRQTRSSSKKTTHIEILEEAVAALKGTKLTHLATPTPTTSSDPMPTTTTRTQETSSTAVNTSAAALAITPTTANELLLLTALREAENKSLRSEIHAFELQASNILNEAYAARLTKKLAAQEEKRLKKAKTKLVGDGLPRLLSGDEFYELAKEKEREVQEEERQKAVRKDGRAAYKEAVEEWTVAEQNRKDAKERAVATFKKTLAAWERKRDSAKSKGKKFVERRPKQDPFPKAIPKPKLKDFLERGGKENEAVEGGDGSSEGDEGVSDGTVQNNSGEATSDDD